MERIREFLRREQEYEPIENGDDGEPSPTATRKPRGFNYVEYGIFLLLGISMLWAWNMFLAAGPYFQRRFHSNSWIYENFQAAEISVSTITNLGSMLILTRLQANASYPKRIVASLLINMVVFSLLAISTAVQTSAEVYFGFLMVVMFLTSLATGLCQNGIFAYVSGFAEPRYTQGIMTGQAVAGVLPCILQIVSVLSVQGRGRMPHEGPPHGPPPVPWTAALAYFVTATAISVVTLLAFGYLFARNWQPKKNVQDESDDPDAAAAAAEDRKAIPLLYLLRKLVWLAGGVFVTFVITMVFPVFTQQIVSVRPPEEQSPILQPPSFIPLALLFWNAGDLIGRLITAVPSLSLVLRPRIVFGLAVSRVVFIGLYHLCNIRGQGAIVNSDFFYLVMVQLFFGLSNGYLGSTCMIGAGECVEEEEREAAGGFMGLCLVAGLTVGSLLSFFITGL
ncbi:Nucleoside transporter FUN26 [Lecanosticta acicola]|uniref:Nucleoside transporter FUN26 n=1 Tax=Lecanosticta acicola TaxID=111012 RepID=A0AAI8Z4R6_9PEZI|nr:Nucleoside transporter FUN26 [Lecanosticta acicola]